MRTIHIMRSIAAMLLVTLFASCAKEPQSPTPSKPKAFIFDGIETTYTTITVDILPEVKEMEYIAFITERKYFDDRGIDTAQELLDDDHMYFRQMAEQYEMQLYDFLSSVGWLVSGDKRDYQAYNLKPATEYILYCYGVEFEGDYYDITTDICYTSITTSSPAMVDVDFAVEVTTSGNTANFSIDPGQYDGLYYAKVVPGHDPSYVLPNQTMSQEQINMLRYQTYNTFNQRINEEGIAPESFCMQGTTQHSSRLEPNMSYMIAVFALSDEQLPMLCSEPTLAHFTTGDNLLSDMTIEIVVDDITPYTAQMTLKPSSNEPYAAIMIRGSEFKSLPEDEMEAMQTIIEFYQPAIFRGEFSEQLMPLMPEQEYTVIAFGCDEGLPSSHLFTHTFRATAATEGDVYLEDIVVHKFFDIEEIAAIDSSYAPMTEECECVVLVEALTNVPCDKIYYWWYDGFMLEEYSTEAFLEDLLLYGYTPSPEIMGLWYDSEFFFAGIAEDEEGNLSEIYFGEKFTLKREDRSPAEEFFELIK